MRYWLLILLRALHLEGYWKGFTQAPSAVETWDTGVDLNVLRYVGAASVTLPTGFVCCFAPFSVQNVHPHLQKTHCEARLTKLRDAEGLDWATAEVQCNISCVV